jgi:hypothetical protein
MPFSQVFEENVNRNMQEDAHGSEDNKESDIKNHFKASEAKNEEEDHELSEKKDRPPRFSTVFGGTPPPQVIERYMEPPKKKKGVYIPLPLFIVLAIILFFESTLLFAYTIIALDNNLPSGLFPIGSTRIDECNCAQQPAINVAPKFFVGAADTSAQPDSLSTTTSTTSTTKPTAQGTAHTTKIVTVKPTPVAVSSVINLTVDQNGSTLSPSPKTTTTSGNAKKRASLESALKSIISAKNQGGEKEAPTPTTLVTATTSPTKDDATTSSAAGGGGPCFGGAGAVGLVCPGGVGTGGKI